jgi:hypothetical protein
MVEPWLRSILGSIKKMIVMKAERPNTFVSG